MGGKITFVGADNKVYGVDRSGFQLNQPDDQPRSVLSFGKRIADVSEQTLLKISYALQDHSRTDDVDVESHFARFFKLPDTSSHKELKRCQHRDAAKKVGLTGGARTIKFIGADGEIYQATAVHFEITPDNILRVRRGGFFTHIIKLDEATRLKIALVLATEATENCSIDAESYYAALSGRDRTTCEEELERRKRLASIEASNAKHQAAETKPQCNGCARIDEDTTHYNPDCPVHVLPGSAKRTMKVAPSAILKPIIDDKVLFGTVDRTLSEMKHIVDHPGEFDSATFQTMKHHIEDLELFLKYATGKLVLLGVKKSLPPTSDQAERGY